MNDEQAKTDTYRLRDENWAKLADDLPELQRILAYGPKSEEDLPLVLACLNLVCAELCLRKAEAIELLEQWEG